MWQKCCTPLHETSILPTTHYFLPAHRKNFYFNFNINLFLSFLLLVLWYCSCCTGDTGGKSLLFLLHPLWSFRNHFHGIFLYQINIYGMSTGLSAYWQIKTHRPVQPVFVNGVSLRYILSHSIMYYLCIFTPYQHIWVFAMWDPQSLECLLPSLFQENVCQPLDCRRKYTLYCILLTCTLCILGVISFNRGQCKEFQEISLDFNRSPHLVYSHLYSWSLVLKITNYSSLYWVKTKNFLWNNMMLVSSLLVSILIRYRTINTVTEYQIFIYYRNDICTIVGVVGKEKFWKRQLEDEGKVTKQPSWKPSLGGQAGTV